MFNVCPACGEYRADKMIDPSGPFAVCPACGYAHRFLRLPLFVVQGASGTGKTTLCLALAAAQTACVALDCDILWRPEFDTPADDYHAFRATWLNLAKNIGQAGRPVVLFGSAGPDAYEPQAERRYFAAIHYLALVCDDATLEARLAARPSWRQSGGAGFVAAMRAFNGHIRERAAVASDPPMTLLDTTGSTLAASLGVLQHWIGVGLAEHAGQEPPD
ncbi:MAG TPA: nucleoside kinase [Chloroflexia bacterium]|nr:nucleoside kinase [Chloroflexia bacterium]